MEVKVLNFLTQSQRDKFWPRTRYNYAKIWFRMEIYVSVPDEYPQEHTAKCTYIVTGKPRTTYNVRVSNVDNGLVYRNLYDPLYTRDSSQYGVHK